MIIRQRDDLLSTKIGFLRHVMSVFGLENIDGSDETEQRADEPTVSIRMRWASSFSHLFSSWLNEKEVSRSVQSAWSKDLRGMQTEFDVSEIANFSFESRQRNRLESSSITNTEFTRPGEWSLDRWIDGISLSFSSRISPCPASLDTRLREGKKTSVSIPLVVAMGAGRVNRGRWTKTIIMSQEWFFPTSRAKTSSSKNIWRRVPSQRWRTDASANKPFELWKWERRLVCWRWLSWRFILHWFKHRVVQFSSLGDLLLYVFSFHPRRIDVKEKIMTKNDSSNQHRSPTPLIKRGAKQS